MRLRLVVPGRRRGRGLGGLSARAGAAYAALALLVVVAGCGGGTPAPRGSGRTPATPRVAPQAQPLELGFTEANPHLYAPGHQPAPFARWRDAVVALHPRYVRILVEWNHLQPRRDAPPDWAERQDGCDRGIAPCASYAGVRDELLAAKAAGLEVMVTFLFAPEWAAAPPSGCERAGTQPWQRAPADLGAYRALVRSLLAEAHRDRVDIRWWSAWNEPNHPAFLNPQRAACDPSAPSLSPGRYAGLVRALRTELDGAPGEHRIVLGDLSGLTRSSSLVTGAGEFVRALPRDVACSGAVWAQHVYVERHGELSGTTEDMPPGSEPLLGDLDAALASHACPGPRPPIWITETGVDPRTGPAGCVAMAQALRTWADDRRIAAAFQYTVRDDPLFASGLLDARLTRLHDVYPAWRAAGAGHPGGGCQP